MDYEERLKIPIIGNDTTEFTTVSGCLISIGYRRIVLGGRGPYVEFTHPIIENFHVPKHAEWRKHSSNPYYIEWRCNQDNVKMYQQLKPVDYADYLVGMYYISPFLLYVNQVVLITRLK